MLCAHGWAGQTQLLFYWRRFSQSEKRNSVAAESEGGQKFRFPDPFPFCPPPPKVDRRSQIKNSFQKKFELPHKNSSFRKIAFLKALFSIRLGLENSRFCFGESSSFEQSSKLNEIQQSIFCIFAKGETSKFSE